MGALFMNVDEYHKMAAIEDRMWYFRALHRHIERELRAEFGERSGAVLDAGCGTGGLILRMADRHPAWRWTGIDASELACELARTRVSGGSPAVAPSAPAQGDHGVAPVNVDHAPAVVALPGERSGTPIVNGSVTALPFAGETFDAVVSADVLYHVDDDEAALREFVRVLRPGGLAIINVPAYRWLWSYHDEAVHSRRRYRRRELIAKLQRAGFHAIRATYWNTLPFPLVVVRRKLLPPPKEGSDVHLFPAPVEAAFNAAMAIERGWLRTFGGLPFGTSVFAVARKPSGA